MRTRILLACLMLTCLPGLAQSTQDDTEIAEPENPLQQVRMMLPPPVSGAAYATIVGAEERSNFFAAGVTLSGGYVWNLDPATGTVNIDEATYLVQPTLTLDRTSSRFHSNLTYDPAFTWYQLPNVVRTTNQSVSGDMQWSLAKYLSLRVGEKFLRTSTAFGQIMPSFQPSVGGSTQSLTPGIVSLYEPHVSAETTAGLTWQYGRNDMVAGSGWLNNLDFTNPAEAGDFYNTISSGGSGSWTHRMGEQQYLGGLYQYATTEAKPVASRQVGTSRVRSDNLLGYYTMYLSPRLSLSVQGGGQYTTVTQSLFYPESQTWKPAGTASLGWQGYHTSFAASFSRMVTAGSGLLGAYMTDTVSAAARWQMTRSWTVGADGEYSNIGNIITNSLPGAIRHGNSASGSALLEHQFSRSLLLSGSYSRLHQTWGNIGTAQVGNKNPDSDRVLVSLSYLISRPIGR